MAGMLPGVESARRRRFHKSGGCLDSPLLAPHNSTRRSAFCLYASNNESRLSSSSSLQRGLLYQAHLDESLGGAAREAKQRLDGKFRAQRVSESKSVEGRRKSLEELGTEIYGGSKKSGSSSRRFSWSKLSWKTSEQEDCAVQGRIYVIHHEVCLETLRIGETLIPLPCAHRFHSRCLKPWLENNSHCPCCRTTILSL